MFAQKSLSALQVTESCFIISWNLLEGNFGSKWSGHKVFLGDKCYSNALREELEETKSNWQHNFPQPWILKHYQANDTLANHL